MYLDEKPDTTPVLQPRKRNKKSRDEQGTPYNYIYPDGDTYIMVLGSYKTNQTYGVYETKAPYEIPNALAQIIKGYIKKSKVNDNEFLIRTTTAPNSKGEFNPFKDGSFTSKISNAFKVKYDKHTLGIDNLRHMFLTSGVDLSKMTTNAKDALSFAMGHSIGMQDRYRQITSNNDESNNEQQEEEAVDNAEVDAEEEGGQCASCEAHKEAEEPNVEPAGDKAITPQDLLNKQYELVNIQIQYYKAKIEKMKDT